MPQSLQRLQALSVTDFDCDIETIATVFPLLVGDQFQISRRPFAAHLAITSHLVGDRSATGGPLVGDWSATSSE